MDRKILLGLISFSLIAVAMAILLPGGKTPEAHPKLPWDIQQTDAGHTKIFDLTLYQSTLEDAQTLLGDDGKVSLFATPDNQYYIEAFFERMDLSGLRASFVMALNVDSQTTMEMFKRGLRMKSLETGNKQIDLTPEDIAQLKNATIQHITYVPVANLDEELLASRFGAPRHKLADEEPGVIHWLYPEKGLDIAIHEKGKEVLQYLDPTDFNQVLDPLQQLQTQQSTNEQAGAVAD